MMRSAPATLATGAENTPGQWRLLLLSAALAQDRAVSVKKPDSCVQICLAAAEDRGHNTGLTVAVHHGNHPQGFFTGRIGNGSRIRRSARLWLGSIGSGMNRCKALPNL